MRTVTRQHSTLERFREEGNGKYEYVLKSFYVYFYAWATWKVFDASAEHRDGVVTFITTSGYLSGLGFRGCVVTCKLLPVRDGLLMSAQRGYSQMYQPVSFLAYNDHLRSGFSFAVRHRLGDTSCYSLHTEVSGRREAKYEQLATLTLDDQQWRTVRSAWDAPFTPASDSVWDDYPALDDLMPWSVKGVKPNRTWVYAPSRDVLKERWGILIAEEDLDRKRELFKGAETGP